MDKIEDTRQPHERDACPECEGSGEIPGQREWDTGYYEMEICPRCRGTGAYAADEKEFEYD